MNTKAANKSNPRDITMTASILTLLSMFGISMMLQLTFKSFPLLSGIISLLCCIFIYEWYNVHGDRLSRRHKACFDVSNVLETYQTRARALGHLFKPDPPTPGVTFATTEGTSEKHNDFINTRDSHYANMYEKALLLAKEMEAMDLTAPMPVDSVSSSNNDDKVIPKLELDELSTRSTDSESVSTARTLSEVEEAVTARSISEIEEAVGIISKVSDNLTK